MHPVPAKDRHGSQDGPVPIMSTSRPTSPFPARNPFRPRATTSQSPDDSTASSFDFGTQRAESTADLLQYPRPTFHHQNSSTSSFSSNYDGDTICNTPNEKGTFSLYDGALTPKHGRFSRSVNSFQKQLDPASYTIETLDEHDDAELLSPWKRKLYRLSPLFTLLAVSAYFLYYGYRIHCTVYAQRAYHKTYIMAWLFIAAEGCVACE